MNPRLTSLLVENQPLPDNLFDRVLLANDALLSYIATARRLGNGGCFSSPFRSYIKPAEKVSQKETSLGKRHPNREETSSRAQKRAKKGWLVASGKFRWPVGFSNLCNKFCQAGAWCRHGTNFQFVHKVYPNDFSAEERTSLEKFVRETENVHFSDQVQKKRKISNKKGE